MEATAVLKHIRISPTKLRPVANLVRGMPIQNALAQLHYSPKRGAAILSKVIESARANAHEKQIDVDTLKIKTVQVDGGPTMYRIMTRQRGMAHHIQKRTSHLKVVLGD